MRTDRPTENPKLHIKRFNVGLFNTLASVNFSTIKLYKLDHNVYPHYAIMLCYNLKASITNQS